MSGSLPAGWRLAFEHNLPAREPRYRPFAELQLTGPTTALLARGASRGLFEHQFEALVALARGSDTCLTTGTASGKTLVFQAAAIEALVNDPRARVLALYPQRALGNEQERRWQGALVAAGLSAKVGRVDGSVDTAVRSAILDGSRVLVATPDVTHAWLLSHLADSSVRRFLANLRLIVVDEVHTYTGVLGSNAAYLFRRIDHCARLLGANPQFFAASATMRDPAGHAGSLFGRDLVSVGPDRDTSPRFPLRIRMLRRPEQHDALTELSSLLSYIVANTSSRFLAFVDSRKQAEQIAAIVNRGSDALAGEDGAYDDSGDAELGTFLRNAAVLPYRAGYEEHDRAAIERRLTSGTVRGVVSTSALELGMDIAHLDLGLLFGVPRSSTAFLQRIGRIGRTAPGEILVVHGGDVADDTIFANPPELLRRPPAEGALYLENRRIQYIHAMCLARQGGEHDALMPTESDRNLTSATAWPPGFLELCQQERTGQIPSELRPMKAESGDDPNHVYPLRDVESQFKVSLRLGPIREAKGQLSYSQVMREAYPGAVYLYVGEAYRVTSVSQSTKTVSVRRERRYSTKPNALPTLVFPNLQRDAVVGAQQRGGLTLIETELQVTETLVGYRERRGGNEVKVDYPLDPASGLLFSGARFRRNFFTSGVIVHHAGFDVPNVDLELVARLLFEALLMTAPYERVDVGFATDRFRATVEPIALGTKFVCIYDQTYGSLRLSGRLLQPEVLPAVAVQADTLLQQGGWVVSPSTQIAFDLLKMACLMEPRLLTVGGGVADRPESGAALPQQQRVILPKEQGVSSRNGNVLFFVERVLLHPSLGLAYRGAHEGGVHGKAETVAAEDIIPIPGLTKMGWYDFDSGEVTPDVHV